MKRMLKPALFILCCGSVSNSIQRESIAEIDGEKVFERFLPPQRWSEKFWNSEDAKILRAMQPRQIAELVPTQAGLRFCRCPSCGMDEMKEPLRWSIKEPHRLKCQNCQAVFPNDDIPAKDKDKKIPEDVVLINQKTTHRYPYHAPVPELQRFEGEKIYLDARKDCEARDFLSKACFYASAAVHSNDGRGNIDADAMIAAIILLRFAQLYPDYALHLDQPNRPKLFELPHQPPPYRAGYMTAKWDWSGATDVPLNLLIAYAMIRDHPAIDEAGKILNAANPRELIEDKLFRASAEFTLDQPEEVGEPAFLVNRGVLAVGRLLEDRDLTVEAIRRFDGLFERGFSYDGLWRGGTASSQDRVLDLVDRWIEPLLTHQENLNSLGQERNADARARSMIGLARSAATAMQLGPIESSDIHNVSWPPRLANTRGDSVGLLGGSAVVRLAAGLGDQSLAVQLRSLGSIGSEGSRRQSLRLQVGDRELLTDLDEQPARMDGWDRASASHNTVMIDGRNQRETFEKLRGPAPGGRCLFFAADPDFQVAVIDDPNAYPKLTSDGRYRQTLILSSGPESSYAASVFEVEGGHQHDQLWHGPPDGHEGWITSIPMQPGPVSLLPRSVPYLPDSAVDDGRWFVQSLGAFKSIEKGSAGRPSYAELDKSGPPGVRLHFMGDGKYEILTARSPNAPPNEGHARASLMVRRSSPDRRSDSLKSRFVTVMEPIITGRQPFKVGRLPGNGRISGLRIETADGPENLLINTRPGTVEVIDLGDGRRVRTDALALRIRGGEMTIAGGSFAKIDNLEVRQENVSGQIVATERFLDHESRGWFELDGSLAHADQLAGRTIVVKHGDDVTHAWTIQRVEEVPGNRTRIYLREEPGFTLEGVDKVACFYQFPGSKHPGPHTFVVNQMARRNFAMKSPD